MRAQDDGSIALDDGPAGARLTAALWKAGGWRPVALEATDEGFAGGDGASRLELALEPAEGGYAYELALTGTEPTRARLGLTPAGLSAPYHLLPGVLFGDNNLAHTRPDRFPTLTDAPGEHPNHAPCWELRADRCACPVSVVAHAGGVAAISVAPYCDDARGRVADPAEEIGGPEAFARNGVVAGLPWAAEVPAVGVTLGYRNTPLTYHNKGGFGDPTMHALAAGSTRGRLFVEAADDRLAVHRIIRATYAETREAPDAALDRPAAMARLRTAMTTIGWSETDDNCTDMKADRETGELAAFRVNDEIAWTGGAPTALPLLMAAHRAGDAESAAKATRILDRIADPATINPESGWLYDVAGLTSGRHVGGWWSGAGAHHYAYTNGEACAYLLAAHRFARDEMGEKRPAWRDTPLAVLRRARAVQRADGNFGYAYDTGDGEMVDPEGFAGCWFAAALAEAHRVTGSAEWLAPASRAMGFYDGFVRALHCWGTPMDTFKAVDQEGVLAFIRAARLLHEAKGDDAYLAMLERGAEYEYLWRFAFRARPQAPPLRGSSWNACGGSLTSTSNPHIHPMGLLVTGDLLYLAAATGDAYHRRRAEDGIRWALCSLDLYPDEVGYGAPGVLTERFCPSDGLLKERYADGTPASVWWTYHVWGAANVLEGLLAEDAWPGAGATAG